jgi:hypothetical protein
MKGVLIALLVLVGLRIVIPRIRRFADPDPSVYGHPRGRV